jgi:hypothetical protein
MSLVEANHQSQKNHSHDGLIFTLTRYHDIRNKTFHILALSKWGGENHLHVPPIWCPCPDEGSISVVPPKTSTTTNRYIRIQ